MARSDDTDGVRRKIHDTEAAFDLLSDLERQTPDEIRKQRSSERIEIKAPVVIHPGNASDTGHKEPVSGVTGDVSAGGSRVMSPVPLHVGDVYRLAFERNVLDLPTTFARCMRCRLIREDAFEVGFLFFTRIELPDQPEDAGPSDLLGGAAESLA